MRFIIICTILGFIAGQLWAMNAHLSKIAGMLPQISVTQD